MKQEIIDRRIKYTRHVLQEAMIDLLEVYSIADISVSMLCKKADINRSTFYAHYENAPQLLRQLESTAMENLQSCILAHCEPYREEELEQTMQQILTYLAQNQRLFRALLGKNGAWDFKGMMINLLHTELMHITSPEQRKNKAVFDYMIEFSVSGSTSVIQRWLETGLKEAPEEIARIVTHMLLKNVAEV